MGNLVSCCSVPEKKEPAGKAGQSNSAESLNNETKNSTERKDSSQNNSENEKDSMEVPEKISKEKSKEELREVQSIVIVEVAKLLNNRVQLKLADKFEKLAVFLNNDSPYFNSITSIVGFLIGLLSDPPTKISDVKDIGQNVKKIYRNHKNAEMAKSMENPIANQQLNPDENIMEIAKGILEICTAYELLFMEAMVKKENGRDKIKTAEVDLMADTLIGIIIEHLQYEKPTKLTCEEIIKAVINFEMSNKSTFKKVLDAISDLKKQRTDFTLEFKENKPLKVKPEELFVRPLILNDNLKYGDWKRPASEAETAYVYKLPAKKEGEEENKTVEAEMNEMKSKNLSEVAFRLLFPNENVDDEPEKYRPIPNDKRNEQLKDLKFKMYLFQLKRMKKEVKEKLLKEMCDLEDDDSKKEVLEELQKISKQLDEMKKNSVLKVDHSHPEQIMTRKGDIHINTDVEHIQKGAGSQKHISENIVTVGSSYRTIQEN